MPYPELPNKPLVEAIFEVHWKVSGLEPPGAVSPVQQGSLNIPGGIVDDSYEVLLGTLSAAFSDQFAYHERLPLASVPVELVPYNAQHRFRKNVGGWPLFQMGPGLLTLNSTQDYNWSSFQNMAVQLFDKLLNVHPKKEKLLIQQLILRYIDAEPVPLKTGNVLEFLHNNLHTVIELPRAPLSGGSIESSPEAVHCQVVYRLREPAGRLRVAVYSGQREGTQSIIWETSVISSTEDLPTSLSKIDKWLVEAHNLTDLWFFEMIKGDLHKKYSNG